MGKHAYTKTLKKATPTIRTSDSVVKSWEVEVIYQSTENGWKTTYSERDDVEYMGKTVDQFTKADLLALVTIPDAVFDAHWEAHNSEPTEERVSNFDISSLS